MNVLGKPHEVTSWFNALRHVGDIQNRDEESIEVGACVYVKDCFFEGNPPYQVAYIVFDYCGDEWDAAFDTPDSNGILAPIGTFQEMMI